MIVFHHGTPGVEEGRRRSEDEGWRSGGIGNRVGWSGILCGLGSRNDKEILCMKNHVEINSRSTMVRTEFLS